MAAQVRIVFTPVLNALKSGLAQAKNMIQGALAPLQKQGDFSFGVGIKEQTSDLKAIERALKAAGYEAKVFAATVREMGGAPSFLRPGAEEDAEIIKATGGEFSNLRDLINGTIDGYRNLQNSVENWGLSAKNAAKVTAALQTQMESAADVLGRKFLPNFKEVESALRAAGYQGGVMSATVEQIDKALNQAGKSTKNVFGASMDKLGKKLGSSGRRLSWFGFRLLMVGRIFTRFITKTLRKAIQGFTRWDDSITQIGTSMGFLAASGLLTADVQNMMIDAMMDLPRVGMQVQGIMGAITALFINMGSDIIPILSGALMNLITAISDVWEASKGDLIPIFERLANETIPKFIEILQSVGPDAITGFVTGLETGINALTGLLDALEPHLPAFSEFLGYLVGLSPVIMAVGMGLFFMSVPLQIVSSLISGAGGLLGSLKNLTPMLLESKIGFLGLGTILLLVAGFVGALLFWWDELVAFWNKTVGPALENLFKSLGKLREALFGAETSTKEVGRALTVVFAVALEVVMTMLTALILTIDGVIQSITWMVNALKKAGTWISRIFGGSEDAVKSFNDTHNEMIEDIEDAYLGSVGDMMAEQYDTARESLENLLESQMNPTVIPQTIPIEISITIENMSSEMDLDTMTDEVSRKLAGKIEGAFR